MAQQNHIHNTIAALQKGELVCFPTDTVYALACDATNEEAITKIFDLKQRDRKKPLSLLVKDLETAMQYGTFSPRAQKLAQKFWPGALTIIVPKKENGQLSPIIDAGTKHYGFRVPQHPLALDILEAIKTPLIGTSVNISGEAPLTDAHTITHLFADNITTIDNTYYHMTQQASTVVTCTGDQIKILRLGEVTKETIEQL